MWGLGFAAGLVAGSVSYGFVRWVDARRARSRMLRQAEAFTRSSS